MNAEPTHNGDPIDGYVATLDEQTLADTNTLIELMKRVTGNEPTLWNVGTIGFGAYHFKYDSGREGDGQAASFYPRKGKITVYLMDGTSRHTELLAKLGKHTTSRVCVYIGRLSDVDLAVLEEVVRDSYEYVMSQDGHMHRIL